MVGGGMLVGKVLDSFRHSGLSARGRGMSEKKALGMTGTEGFGERGVARVWGRVVRKGLGRERGQDGTDRADR